MREDEKSLALLALSEIRRSTLVARSVEDVNYWFSVVNDICIAHEYDLPGDLGAVEKIISDTIEPLRIAGRFLEAEYYAMALSIWLLKGRIRFASRGRAILSLLVQLGRASGQEENYYVYRKMLKLIGMSRSVFNDDIELDRLAIDGYAQLLTTFSNSKSRLREALQLQLKGKEVTDRIFFSERRKSLLRDSQGVCVESYYNLIDLKFRLFGPQGLYEDFARYRDLLQEINSTVNVSELATGNTTITREANLVADIFQVKMLARADKVDDAIERANVIWKNGAMAIAIRQKLIRAVLDIRSRNRSLELPGWVDGG